MPATYLSTLLLERCTNDLTLIPLIFHCLTNEAKCVNPSFYFHIHPSDCIYSLLKQNNIM